MDSNATGNRESQGNPKDQGKPEDSVSPGKSQASAPTSTSSDPGPAAKPEQSGSSSKPQAAGSARTAQGPGGPGKTQDTVASGDASKAQENRAKYLKPLGRLAKYLALVIMVLILVRLVFDCYSFYIARRDIDAELQSKRVSSLEYLNLLSQRARAGWDDSS